MIQKGLKKCLLYLICVTVLLASLPVSATGEINVSEPDENGLVTISGSISAGAERPVSVLVVNTSVDAETDRLGGIRFSDAAISGAGGAYSFTMRPADAGAYQVRVNGNNGVVYQEAMFTVEAPVLQASDSIDAPGEATCVQLKLNKGGNIDTLSFTLTYDDDVFEVAGTEAIAASEYFAVKAANVQAGAVTCTLKKTKALPVGELSVCLVDAMIKSGTAYDDYTISVAAEAQDRMGSATTVDTEDAVFTVQAVSPKTEAKKAALEALALVKAAENITYDNYENELSVVTDAREKLDYALSLNVKQTDFSAYLTKLSKAEEKLAELKAGFEVLALLNEATEETVFSVLEEHKEVFGITESMLEILKLLENTDTIKAELVGKGFLTPTAAEKAFCEKLAFESIKQLDWPNMANVFVALNSVFGFDLEGDFAELSEQQQNEVYRAIAKNEYATFEALRKAFKNAVDEAEDSGSKGSSTASDSRPGRGSVGVSSVAAGASPMTEIPSAYEKEFTDIEDVAWAKDAINDLFERGIISGKSEGKFAPNDTIKREEFVKLIVCALGLYDKAATCEFDDTKPENWYYSYVGSAVRQGIVGGMGDNLFGAGQEITREDIAVILCRAKGLIAEEQALSEPSFSDWEHVSDYAKQSLAVMVEKGFMNGITETELAPKLPATRAQAAVMIYRIIHAAA